MTTIFKKNLYRTTNALAGSVLFLSLFYILYSFNFALWNNEEELPLIYKLMGLASYPGDSFVNYHTSTYTQVTPYIYTLAMIGKIFSLNNISGLFLILHIITIGAMYFSMRSILKKVTRSGEAFIFFIILGLLLAVKFINPIPTARWLFINFLDPELVVFPLLFFSISSFLNKKFLISYINLGIATIIHPLYALPLLFAFCVSLLYEMINQKKVLLQNIKTACIYSSAVLFYTFWVWLKSRQTVFSLIDPSLIAEIIRAPEHFIIPTINSFDTRALLFYIFCIVFSALAFSFTKFKIHLPPVIADRLSASRKMLFSNTEIILDDQSDKAASSNFQRLVIVTSCLAFLLVFSSFIAHFIKIGLLVQLTFYRISSIIIALIWIIAFASLSRHFQHQAHYLKKPAIAGLLAACLFSACISSIILQKTYLIPATIPKKYKFETETISWIQANTESTALFLNYTGIDLRTFAMRPVYFSFKAFHLTSDSQLVWYGQYLIFNDIPDSFRPEDYRAIREYSKMNHAVDIPRVIKKSGAPIKYILIKKSDDHYAFLTGSFPVIYENKSYCVFKNPGVQ